MNWSYNTALAQKTPKITRFKKVLEFEKWPEGIAIVIKIGIKSFYIVYTSHFLPVFESGLLWKNNHKKRIADTETKRKLSASFDKGISLLCYSN